MKRLAATVIVTSVPALSYRPRLQKRIPESGRGNHRATPISQTIPGRGNLSRRHFRPVVERMFDSELEEKGETDQEKRREKAAELARQYRPYDLRHTMATLLLKANEHAKKVSARASRSPSILTLTFFRICRKKRPRSSVKSCSRSSLPTLRPQAKSKRPCGRMQLLDSNGGQGRS
jgi:hypothetical protein